MTKLHANFLQNVTGTWLPLPPLPQITVKSLYYNLKISRLSERDPEAIVDCLRLDFFEADAQNIRWRQVQMGNKQALPWVIGAQSCKEILGVQSIRPHLQWHCSKNAWPLYFSAASGTLASPFRFKPRTKALQQSCGCGASVPKDRGCPHS